MRVLHLVNTLDRGGIASSLRELLPILTQREHVAAEVAILYGESQYQAAMSAHGVLIHHLNLTSKYDGRGVFRLAQLFKSGRFQIVHAQGWPAVLFAALASLLAGGPRFVLSEQNVTNRRRHWRLRPLDQFVYSRFQRVVAVSQAAAEALAVWLPQVSDRITLIYNSLDPAHFNRVLYDRHQLRQELGIDGQRPVILFAGGLFYRKGTDLLLQALNQLHATLGPTEPPLTLIAGDGTLDEKMQALAAELRQNDQIRLLGFCSNLSTLMAAADLFVLTSRWEGCPMVVLEAMAMELPIVATRVGGVPELIEDGQSGLLVPAGNTLALSHAMNRLLSDRSFACHLGQMARRRLLDGFTVEHSGQALAAVYESLL